MDCCPQGTNIRGVLEVIGQVSRNGRPREDAFTEAWYILTETNPMPAVCGRICPHPCEDACNRCDRDEPLATGAIERFIGDWGIQQGLLHVKVTGEDRSEKVAVIGAGPAGLSCAYHLVRRGYRVTIFEAMPEAGGMLRYGIPSYRLPSEIIDAEVRKIIDLGVELRTGVKVGRDIPFTDIRSGYDAVFLGIGAHQRVPLNCSGEEAGNVYSGVDFLRLVNSGEPVELGDRVVVVGGGDTAIDAARVAVRLGSRVTIIYRRTRSEMLAIDEEVEEALAEGVEIIYLAAPVEILTENGRAVGMRCQRMELGEPDASGRPRSVPVQGEEFAVDVASVIAAVSQQPGWEGLEELSDIPADDGSGKSGVTSHPKTYAGGDVLNLGLVTTAINQGRRAADNIHSSFRGMVSEEVEKLPVVTSEEINLDYHRLAPRKRAGKVPVNERLKDPWTEYTSTLTADDVVAEARRCMSCGSFTAGKTTILHILRRISQIGVGTILFNSYFAVFTTRQIYGGPFRNICVPGLNCHACPSATMGCPIGMMQHFAAAHRFPWFLIGFLAIIGLISGRFTCGWLCPFGLLQDVMNAFKKCRVRFPRSLTAFKYVVLVGLVIIIPYFTYNHWFSRLCPCGALIAAIPWALWNPIDPIFGTVVIAPDAIGSLFWLKIWILGFFLVLFLFLKRPFCRTICPLGAIYALFNRISLVSLRVKGTCTDCGMCQTVCPMELKASSEINSENCIKCMECLQCEHIVFEWNVPWKNGRASPDG